jgi:hypothetical protein
MWGDEKFTARLSNRFSSHTRQQGWFLDIGPLILAQANITVKN